MLVVTALLEGSGFQVVDLITWNKIKMGMGYRTRRFGEHLVVLQKKPLRAKGEEKSPVKYVNKISSDGSFWRERQNLPQLAEINTTRAMDVVSGYLL